jgi:hypothetical protein
MATNTIFFLDYLIIGSDAGRITIAEYNAKSNSFTVTHQETYGRSGSRRIVPGQYLATDPKGRAVMIGAVEKSKLVYVLNRDAAANLTISSPLEAHRPNATIHAMVGVDVGYENPMFASLEVDYEEADRDPTGEAVAKTEKVRIHLQLCVCIRKSDPLFYDHSSLHTTNSTWVLTTLFVVGLLLSTHDQITWYKCQEDTIKTAKDGKDLVVSWYVQKITSLTSTMLGMIIDCPYLDGRIQLKGWRRGGEL